MYLLLNWHYYFHTIFLFSQLIYFFFKSCSFFTLCPNTFLSFWQTYLFCFYITAVNQMTAISVTIKCRNETWTSCNCQGNKWRNVKCSFCLDSALLQACPKGHYSEMECHILYARQAQWRISNLYVCCWVGSFLMQKSLYFVFLKF